MTLPLLRFSPEERTVNLPLSQLRPAGAHAPSCVVPENYVLSVFTCYAAGRFTC